MNRIHTTTGFVVTVKPDGWSCTCNQQPRRQPMTITSYSEACQKADRWAAAAGMRFGVVRYTADGETTFSIWPLQVGVSAPVYRNDDLGCWAYITTTEEQP